MRLGFTSRRPANRGFAAALAVFAPTVQRMLGGIVSFVRSSPTPITIHVERSGTNLRYTDSDRRLRSVPSAPGRYVSGAVYAVARLHVIGWVDVSRIIRDTDPYPKRQNSDFHLVAHIAAD